MSLPRLLSVVRIATLLSVPLWLYAVALTAGHNTPFLPLGVLVVVLSSLWAARRAGRAERGLGAVLAVGLLYKVTFVSLFVVILFNVYGSGDALLYHRWAVRYVADFWDFGQLPPLVGSSGSDFIRAATAYLYFVTGSSLAIGMLAYGVMAFWGSYFYFLAFRTVFPERDPRLMIVLLFFYPSVVFWTASIGKDALIFMLLGALTYRIAKLFMDWSPRNLAAIAPPLVGVLLVRPHVGLMFLLAAGSALLLGQTRWRSNRVSIRIATAALFSVGVFLVLPVVQERLFLEDLSLASATEFLEWQQRATYRGGSTLDAGGSLAARIARAPLILARPFPWEVHNLTAALAAIEGILFVTLAIARRRALIDNLRHATRHAFVLFIVLLMAEFCVGFSSISNFGILTRQRTMFLPLVFMLFSAPASAVSAPAVTRGRRHDPVGDVHARPQQAVG